MVGVRYVAYALPVTHAIQLLQDVMLRGATVHVWQFWTLLGLGVALFLMSALALRRTLRLT